MKRTVFFLSLALGGITLLGTGCTTYSYTSRSAAINGASINGREQGCEIDIDFSKRVTATSNAQTSKTDAINEAQFMCLEKFGIDVVVDPIYKIEFNVLQKKAYTATVFGYAGTYKNAPVGIDAMKEKNLSKEDIEKYKILTDPSFAKYYYEQPKNGNVTNYYLGEAPRTVQPAEKKSLFSTLQPAESTNVKTSKKQKGKQVVESGEFNSITSLRTGPLDRRAWSLEFGYRSMTMVQNKEKVKFLNDKEYAPGFRFAIGANPTFKYGLGIKTGVNLDFAHAANCKIPRVYGWDIRYERRSLDYVTIGVPLQLSYRYEFMRNLHLMFYTGPILNMHTYRGIDVVDPEDVVDIAWGVGAAFQYKRMRLTVGGDFGIYEQWNKDVKNKKDKTYENSPIYVTIGIML